MRYIDVYKADTRRWLAHIGCLAQFYHKVNNNRIVSAIIIYVRPIQTIFFITFHLKLNESTFCKLKKTLFQHLRFPNYGAAAKIFKLAQQKIIALTGKAAKSVMMTFTYSSICFLFLSYTRNADNFIRRFSIF
jgi:hypothetical protein